MKKRVQVQAFCFGLFLAVGLSLQAQETPDRDQVIAEVGGQKLTVADLQQQQGGKLLQARYQYYMNQRKALDQLIDDKLIEIEAKKRNLSNDQLLNTVVFKELKDPTEDQLQVYYEGMDATEPYEAVRDRVLEHIRDLRREKARAAYVQKLRNNASVQVLLAPPLADVNVKDAYVQGATNPPVTLVEFADYECPYCQKITPELQKLEKEYGDRLAVVYKDFPLPMHHTSQKAAEAARCAGEQGKFWEYHDLLFGDQNRLDHNGLLEKAKSLKLDEKQFDSCLTNEKYKIQIQQDSQEGMRAGVSGTPGFFINGIFLSGVQPEATFEKTIQEQLTAPSK